jgi:DNA-directed RNA polymerase subunit RPC12/RpoP
MEENNAMNTVADEPVNDQTGAAAADEPVMDKTLEAAGGQNKCPKCGATDISLNVSKGLLRCNFCRHEFSPEKAEDAETDLSKLEGSVIGSGAQDIVADTKDVLTFKCSSCAAEVVIDTNEATQARCHWCRNTLSLQQQIPNGAVPDMVLPFKIKKEEAKADIDKFVGKRRFYAHPQFKKEFNSDNVMGVYLPYMVVDVNAHSTLVGQGEHEIRRYTVGSGKDRETYYDADVYDVERDFDIVVEGLTVESSADKRDNKASNKTNNIINSIMPFDTENSVKWNANYLKGYTSEKRDTNVEQLKGLVNTQAKDIARHKTNETLKAYDRGVCWSKEEMNVKGERWKAAYLPVWLYSYHQKNKNLLHYVAVNARTKETMGSVPIHTPKLFLVSAIIELVSLILWLFLLIPLFASSEDDYSWILLTAGFIYYAWIYAKYRNKGARHFHEKETKATMDNLQKKDVFVKKRTKLKNARIAGANNTAVRGKTF